MTMAMAKAKQQMVTGDEQKLASLVILLRLPFSVGDSGPDAGKINGGGHDGDIAEQEVTIAQAARRDDGLNKLQEALERNDCNLLSFLGRIIYHYATSSSSAACAFLRLGVRIAFLRYLGNNDNQLQGSEDQRQDDRVCQYERCLLTSLLRALRARSSFEIEEMDVEMAWAAQGLLAKLSKLDMVESKNITWMTLWTEALDTVMARRSNGNNRGSSLPPPMNVTNEESTSLLNEEILMIQTIHAILDRNNSSNTNDEKENMNGDWKNQYGISLLSFMQTSLHTYSNIMRTASDGARVRLPLWTQNTLFAMIHWSQQTDTLSSDIYWLVLHYLRLCIFRLSNENLSSGKGMIGKLYSSCVAQKINTNKNSKPNNDNVDEFASAMRSYIFYGLVVLSTAQTEKKTEFDSKTQPAPQKTSTSGEISPITMRGGIYLLVLELWQLCGPDWLHMPQSQSPAARLYDLWWFRPGNEKGDEQRTGPTWPLCTVIRLAAGEFRLGLGRWVTITENGKENAGHCAGLVSEIQCCARIVTEAVQLMTAIAEDADTLTVWSPEAILHVRKSLEDALNSSIQYFNALSVDGYWSTRDDSCRSVLLKERDTVTRTCSMVMGIIAAELEMEHLLAITGSGMQSSRALGDDKITSSFACALHAGIQFCHSLGERQLLNGDSESDELRSQCSYEFWEPLAYLLPCIMSLVSNATSGQEENELNSALATLCEGGCLIVSLPSFLRRMSKHWLSVLGGANQLPDMDDLDIQQLDSMLSLVKLCALTMNEIVTTLPTLGENYLSSHIDVYCELELWNKILKKVHEWPRQTLKTSAGLALVEIHQCMVILPGPPSMRSPN